MKTAGALLVVDLFVCSTAVPVLAQTARTTAAADLALIEWSNDRKLARADFKGAVPTAGGLAAQSAIAIKASWECDSDRFSASIRAVFDPARSWWGGPMLSRFQMWNAVSASDRDRQLLQHEQTHFDVAETVARKIRSYFESLTEVCTRPNGMVPLRAVVEDFQRDLDKEQERYDRETQLGTDASAQMRWTYNTLKALAASK
jgi:hypothetical protein